MPINEIPSLILKKAGQGLDKFSRTNFMTKNLAQSVSDPARFAAGMLVTSIVSKDLVGCAFYTTQSLNNKKIPEDKRKFVACLDLVNGILMVGGQFLIGKIIDAKLTPWLTGKFTGTIKDKFTGIEKTVNPNAFFHPDNLKKLIEKNIKPEEIGKVNTEKVAKLINKLCKSPFEKGFGILVAAIATTAITKRTIVPLLSTPIAGWFKDTLDKKDKKNKNSEEVNRTISTAAYNKTDDTIKK